MPAFYSRFAAAVNDNWTCKRFAANGFRFDRAAGSSADFDNAFYIHLFANITDKMPDILNPLSLVIGSKTSKPTNVLCV